MRLTLDSPKRRWLTGPVIAGSLLAWAHLSLICWAIALGGIFRGKNPDVEPWIQLTSVAIPFFLGFFILIVVYPIVCYRFSKERQYLRATLNAILGIMVIAGFVFGMFIAAMAFS